MLTTARLHEILDYDPETGLFKWKVYRRNRTNYGISRGYRTYGIDGRRYKAHRLAWLYVHGEWPTDEVDHIDENKLNNRIDNLRLATHSQNGLNQTRARRDNKSTGIRGVYFHKTRNRFSARVMVNKVDHVLGYFDTAEEAHRAYVAAKKRLTSEQNERTLLSASKSV